jgi:hypothetical protein
VKVGFSGNDAIEYTLRPMFTIGAIGTGLGHPGFAHAR